MTFLRRTPPAFALSRLARTLSTRSGAPPLTIGIRREDPSRLWERRCPLTPDVVAELVSRGDVRVLVQDCDRRVFPMSEFAKAGAEPHPTLEPAHIVVGIKETPLSELLTSPAPGHVPRTHVMFSHTAKGQPYNTPLLARFLADPTAPTPAAHAHPRLIDYELITDAPLDAGGKRTVAFGWFAGVAGALEALSALAHAQLERGVASPLLYTPRPHTHSSLSSLRNTLRGIGELISEHGTPRSLGPLVLGVTGNGQVAKGVLSILDELPLETVPVSALPALVADPKTDLRKVYLVHALPGDYLTRADGAPYERADYYANPSSYESTFSSTVAPYLSLLLNCAGWAPGFPRLMTDAQLADALERAHTLGKGRLASIGDISCDIGGGLESLTHASTLSEPYYTARPAGLPAHLPGVQLMAVDILPTALPLDASAHFSAAFAPYLDALIAEYRAGGSNSKQANPALRESLRRATIAEGGALKEPHQWLGAAVKAWRAGAPVVEALPELASAPSPWHDRHAPAPVPAHASAAAAASAPEKPKAATRGVAPKRVVLFGSGMVAGPAVDELCRHDVELIVASNSLTEAENLTHTHTNASAVRVDMSNTAKVEELVGGADLVISLLPVPFHPAVAELCIKHQKHLVTASYISPAMKALHDKAAAADVLLLNEIGLDPGIDHCSAHAMLADLRAQDKQVLSFISFCGGLPAPECADVPLGYKFSWSPRGVLGATLNSATFQLSDQRFDIPEALLLAFKFPEVPISNVLKFEGIANRDSLSYAETYDFEPVGTAKGMRTLLRGTLRYPGYCDLMQSFKHLGLLNTDTPVALESWTAFVQQSLGTKLGITFKENDTQSLMAAIADWVPASDLDMVLDALRFFSLIPGSPALPASALPPVPRTPLAPIDHLTVLLARRLRYAPGERDLVVLAHEVVARARTPGAPEEVHTAQLVTYGTPRASAMARTVGLPVALAALEVLKGRVGIRGVHGPKDCSVYGAVLEGLKGAGLGMKEGVRIGAGMESTLLRGVSRQ